MAKSPEEYAHLEWIGYVQPVGLVVSVPAMLEAQCYINKNVLADHARFLDCLQKDSDDNVVPVLSDFAGFATRCLEWESEDLSEIPATGELTGDMSMLEVVLPQYHETLRPTHAVPVFRPEEGQSPWMLLIQQLPDGVDLDEATEADSAKRWNAPPQAKFERLLRETGVPIGLLSNGNQIRLVYSPRGESSGYATFNIAEMVQVAGRPMFAALQMLLKADRLFTLGDKQRLPAILENSRKYQNNVSTQLAQQVTTALFELLRGFQAADDHRKGELLREILANNPQHVYHGLLTVLMRLVFVLYAEDRSLVSSDPVYSNHYSISGLFERLRSDAGRFPDTMDQRFGAWAQLLTLFRLVYDGGSHRDLLIPARKGYLFDPDRYPFLEGRYDDGDVGVDSPEELQSDIQVPRISDGVVYRILESLLVLEGERLSYRTLDVEQIGSVYEAVMGYQIEVAQGKSIAIKPVKTHGAPSTINLEALLDTKPTDRAKRLKEWSDQKLSAADAKVMKAAESIDDLLVSLGKKIAKHVTPAIVPAESMVLQPSEERRRSGSHYTPRSLTEPIVRTTLEPILKQLWDSETEAPGVWSPSADDKKRYTKGEIELRIKASERKVAHAQSARTVGTPHPQQILDLKICDPAMGSGAFLVEACRQLGDELIKAWYAHDAVPTDIPPDEDEVLYARRLIAQRCLYGVDKNVMAVDLAKLSLWLVTLAKDHAFTFLDHALRHGDSLVGLTREQIIGFHWEVKKQKKFGEDLIQRRLDRATEARAKILNAREDVPYRDQQQRMASADEALDLIRLVGDACVSGFFAGQKKKEREEHAERLFGVASSYLESLTAGRGKQVDFESRRVLGQAAAWLRAGSHPIPAFHWEIEFPEVFARENGGFDAFVGNPPFAGKNTVVNGNRAGFLDWLKRIHEETHGNSDLVAHFFRRAFDLLRTGATLGLIATNTIQQGDTRSSGLRWIREHNGNIFYARRRMRWPGEAAVVVSVVSIVKGDYSGVCLLDGREVEKITAYLFHEGSDSDPHQLKINDRLSFQGAILLGLGFTFDDTSANASPISDMQQLIADNPKNKEVIFPYIGGEELLNEPLHHHHRYAIDFFDRSLEEAADWPELLEIVRQKVKPDRDKQKRDANRERWWQYAEKRPGLNTAKADLKRVLAISRVGQQGAMAFLPKDMVYADSLVVFMLPNYSDFTVLQSRVHEIWARFFSSSMKDDMRYTPTDCFETFPRPIGHLDDLESVGRSYYEHRASLMADAQVGLTKTYNRFHDPHEQSEGILELRRLHGLMDAAVLRAYGWDDLAESARCEFLLDYEEEEDDEPGAIKSKKKKPWRYRWPDEFRDEVLARLLELNEQRHKEEVAKGLVIADGKASNKKASSKPKPTTSKQSQQLF